MTTQHEVSFGELAKQIQAVQAKQAELTKARHELLAVMGLAGGAFRITPDEYAAAINEYAPAIKKSNGKDHPVRTVDYVAAARVKTPSGRKMAGRKAAAGKKATAKQTRQGKLPPKFKGPNGELWSGKARPPRFIADYEREHGEGSRKDLLIDKR